MTRSDEARIHLVRGDITGLNVDGIVTAANRELRGGGGVDGAVHRAAGPELLRASRRLAPCAAGSAVITAGFALSARYVIHATGPVFGDLERDSHILASTCRASLALARDNQLRHLAFPCISTGVYGFPPEPACAVATDTVVRWLDVETLPEIVTFCCFTTADYRMYQRRLAELGVVWEGRPEGA